MIFDENHHDGYDMMDWWIYIFGPFWWIFMLLWWIIYFTVSIIIAYYVHKDAIRRGIANSETWLIIAFILNVIGLILYLLVRHNYSESTSVKTVENKNK